MKWSLVGTIVLVGFILAWINMANAAGRMAILRSKRLLGNWDLPLAIAYMIVTFGAGSFLSGYVIARVISYDTGLQIGLVLTLSTSALFVVNIALMKRDFDKVSKLTATAAPTLRAWIDSKSVPACSWAAASRLNRVILATFPRSYLRDAILIAIGQILIWALLYYAFLGTNRVGIPQYGLNPLIGIIGLIVITKFVLLIVGTPSVALLRTCLRPLEYSERERLYTNVMASRWRTDSHRRGFVTARLIERCIYGLKNRLTEDQFELVQHAYRKLATTIRRTSISAESNRAAYVYFSMLCWTASSLVASENPVRSATRIRRIIANQPEPPASAKTSRLLGWANAIDQFAQQHSRLVRGALVGALVAYLSISGQLAAMVDLIRDFVQR